jgi:transcription initiation factor IIE alpha subunit
MAKVVGFDEKVMKQFTCRDCGAIVQYAPNEAVGQYHPYGGGKVTDEGTHIHGLNCPNCGEFHRTNP